jgi:hypothetical protein
MRPKPELWRLRGLPKLEKRAADGLVTSAIGMWITLGITLPRSGGLSPPHAVHRRCVTQVISKTIIAEEPVLRD